MITRLSPVIGAELKLLFYVSHWIQDALPVIEEYAQQLSQLAVLNKPLETSHFADIIAQWHFSSVADLIPTLHKKTDIKTSLQQIALIFAGVGLIVLLHGVAHDMHLDSPDIAEQGDAEPSSIL
jgi:hypothetical protein